MAVWVIIVGGASQGTSERQKEGSWGFISQHAGLLSPGRDLITTPNLYAEFIGRWAFLISCAAKSLRTIIKLWMIIKNNLIARSDKIMVNIYISACENLWSKIKGMWGSKLKREKIVHLLCASIYDLIINMDSIRSGRNAEWVSKIFQYAHWHYKL